MKALLALFILGLAGVAQAQATTLPPASIRYGADRYCAEVARAAVELFNQRIAGASETNMNGTVAMIGIGDPATGLILKAVIKRLYHGPHPLRTRKAVIDYAYRYCMDTPVPAASTSSQ